MAAIYGDYDREDHFGGVKISPLGLTPKDLLEWTDEHLKTPRGGDGLPEASKTCVMYLHEVFKRMAHPKFRDKIYVMLFTDAPGHGVPIHENMRDILADEYRRGVRFSMSTLRMVQIDGTNHYALDKQGKLEKKRFAQMNWPWEWDELCKCVKTNMTVFAFASDWSYKQLGTFVRIPQGQAFPSGRDMMCLFLSFLGYKNLKIREECLPFVGGLANMDFRKLIRGMPVPKLLRCIGDVVNEDIFLMVVNPVMGQAYRHMHNLKSHEVYGADVKKVCDSFELAVRKMPLGENKAKLQAFLKESYESTKVLDVIQDNWEEGQLAIRISEGTDKFTQKEFMSCLREGTELSRCLKMLQKLKLVKMGPNAFTEENRAYAIPLKCGFKVWALIGCLLCTTNIEVELPKTALFAVMCLEHPILGHLANSYLQNFSQYKKRVEMGDDDKDEGKAKDEGKGKDEKQQQEKDEEKDYPFDFSLTRNAKRKLVARYPVNYSPYVVEMLCSRVPEEDRVSFFGKENAIKLGIMSFLIAVKNMKEERFEAKIVPGNFQPVHLPVHEFECAECHRFRSDTTRMSHPQDEQVDVCGACWSMLNEKILDVNSPEYPLPWTKEEIQKAGSVVYDKERKCYTCDFQTCKGCTTMYEAVLANTATVREGPNKCPGCRSKMTKNVLECWRNKCATCGDDYFCPREKDYSEDYECAWCMNKLDGEERQYETCERSFSEWYASDAASCLRDMGFEAHASVFRNNSLFDLTFLEAVCLLKPTEKVAGLPSSSGTRYRFGYRQVINPGALTKAMQEQLKTGIYTEQECMICKDDLPPTEAHRVCGNTGCTAFACITCLQRQYRQVRFGELVLLKHFECSACTRPPTGKILRQYGGKSILQIHGRNNPELKQLARENYLALCAKCKHPKIYGPKGGCGDDQVPQLIEKFVCGECKEKGAAPKSELDKKMDKLIASIKEKADRNNHDGEIKDYPSGLSSHCPSCGMYLERPPGFHHLTCECGMHLCGLCDFMSDSALLLDEHLKEVADRKEREGLVDHTFGLCEHCPNCGTDIERVPGLHHLTCACGMHLCGLCDFMSDNALLLDEHLKEVADRNEREGLVDHTFEEYFSCPSCGMHLERTAGCLHITCPCGKHLCGRCKFMSETSRPVYEHLREVHGSIDAVGSANFKLDMAIKYGWKVEHGECDSDDDEEDDEEEYHQYDYYSDEEEYYQDWDGNYYYGY
jgi:hypothetical protein